MVSKVLLKAVITHYWSSGYCKSNYKSCCGEIDSLFLLSAQKLFLHLYFFSTMAADLPDFMTNPNAVLNDKDHEWRYNRIPDYNKVNAAYELGKYQSCKSTLANINIICSV